jgi:hypothetical protein
VEYRRLGSLQPFVFLSVTESRDPEDEGALEAAGRVGLVAQQAIGRPPDERPVLLHNL